MLPIQFPTNANLERQQVLAQVVESLLPKSETQSDFGLLPEAWPSRRCCRHLGSASAIGSCLFPSLTFKFNLKIKLQMKERNSTSFAKTGHLRANN